MDYIYIPRAALCLIAVVVWSGLVVSVALIYAIYRNIR